jgi:beta-lactam-binding protein with PASTA domain
MGPVANRASLQGVPEMTLYGKSARKISWLIMVLAAGLASSGCKKAVVPDVRQQDLDQAKQALTAALLKVGNITGTQGTGSYVLTQSLAAGQQVSTNSTVDLTVEAPLLVPDLTKNKVTEAVKTLQVMGLQVTFVKEPTLKLFGGSKIVAQIPAANTAVHHGSMVTITVATPPDLSLLGGLVTKEPAYAKLDPQYRQILDSFLK